VVVRGIVRVVFCKLHHAFETKSCSIVKSYGECMYSDEVQVEIVGYQKDHSVKMKFYYEIDNRITYPGALQL